MDLQTNKRTIVITNNRDLLANQALGLADRHKLVRFCLNNFLEAIPTGGRHLEIFKKTLQNTNITNSTVFNRKLKARVIYFSFYTS